MDNILNKVSIGKAKEILEPFAKMALKGQTPLNVMLIGSPGLGKSSIVREIAEENDMFLVDLRLASLDPTDVGGLPYVTGDEMKFSTPEWLKQVLACGKPCIIFLDEITNATVSTQSAAYRLVLDREVNNGTKLPDNCWIVGAGNSKEDQSGAKPLVPPLANRFGLHLYIDKKEASESFIQYAISQRFDRSIVGFLSWKKANVSVAYNNNPAFATPRSWEYVNHYLKNGMFSGNTLDLVIAGAVGTDISVEFSAYRELNDVLPDWDKLKHDDSYEYELPKDDEGLKYAISVGLAFEMLDSLGEDDKDAIVRLTKFMEEFSDEIKILTFRTMKKDKDTMRKMVKYAELLAEFRTMSKYLSSIEE
jgi:hypothetical protein